MNESKFKTHFEKLAATEPRPYKLRGATLLVEVFPKQELKTTGGIIIGKADNQRANAEEFRRSVGIVLLQGDGYADGGEMEITTGMVIMLPYNPLFLSEFPGLPGYTKNTLALVNEGDVLFAYNSYTDYMKATEVLSHENK